jgi:hypothetical protein
VRLRLGIFLAAFFLYMLSGSRERPWADATPVWQVAESLVKHQTVAIPTRWPYDAPAGRNGKFYAANPLINSLVHLPGAFLRDRMSQRWPKTTPYTWPFACHLAPSVFGALTCVLLFSLCLELGGTRRQATIVTLAGGLASITWVYARYAYSEALQLLAFTGVYLQFVRLGRAPTGPDARWLGLWAAILVASKTVYVVALPLPAVYLACVHRARPRDIVKVVAQVALFLGAAAGLYWFYNWLRWGSPFNDGYVVGPALRRGRLWVGLWGYLASPGKSLLLYSPGILLAWFGLRAMAGRQAHAAWLLPLSVVPVVILNARLPVWHGDFAWGPRYLVFATAALLAPLLFVIQDVAATTVRWRRALGGMVIAGVLAAGVFVQVLGNALYWDHWIRISIDARRAWLGTPNRAGAVIKETGGTCHACFEDLHQVQWLPQFQPIQGHAWLLGHVWRKHDWIRAERDAPWHPTTTLPLNIALWYEAARLDWWGMEYTTLPKTRRFMILVMSSGVLLGAWLWWRGARVMRAAGVA